MRHEAAAAARRCMTEPGASPARAGPSRLPVRRRAGHDAAMHRVAPLDPTPPPSPGGRPARRRRLLVGGGPGGGGRDHRPRRRRPARQLRDDGTLTSPTLADTDGDGLRDTYEDADGDGLTHRQEYVLGLKPRTWDTDRDGLPRRQGGHRRATSSGTCSEYASGTNPRLADTDSDGIRDDREDADKDGLLNVEEQTRQTRPRDADTDDDTWTDANEVRAGDRSALGRDHAVRGRRAALPVRARRPARSSRPATSGTSASTAGRWPPTRPR